MPYWGDDEWTATAFSRAEWEAMPQVQREVYDNLNAANPFGRHAENDSALHQMLNNALFDDPGGDHRLDYATLEDYVEEYYGLDIDNHVDWEAYEELYP